MTPEDTQRVVQQLQAQSIITPEQLRDAIEYARAHSTDVVDAFIQQRLIDEEAMAQIKAQIFGVPYVDLRGQEFPHEVLNTISRGIAENYQVVPWKREGDIVSVGMVDPHNYTAIEALDFIAHNYNVRFVYYLTSAASVQAVLKQYDNITQEVAAALQQQGAGETDDLFGDLDTSEDAMHQEQVKNAPVSKTIAVMLRYAVEGGASDVHIEPVGDWTRVRYRVDGVLHQSLQLPKSLHNALVARIKVLSNLKLDETRLPQDGRFRMKIDGRYVDFRVSTMPLVDTEKVVVRILDSQSGVQTLEDLGYGDHNLDRIHENLKRPHGMILITGPTGSGKSTTLYSMLTILNNESRNIITLEDPVEYNMVGVAQTQVRPEIGLTFVRGLRAVLRQDPDIVMVGEIRDNETAELGIHAALTGHMLLSTLHTNDAIGAIPRLVDMSIEPFLISSALNLIIAQRLARRVCQHCREPLQLAAKTEQLVRAELQQIPDFSVPQDIRNALAQPQLTVYQGKGCRHCEDTGYKGRVAVAELIEMTEQLSTIVNEGKSTDQKRVQEELRNQGMITLRQDSFIKAIRGLTTIEEALTVTVE